MNNKIAVKIILDPNNEKSDKVSVLQLLNKAGMDVGWHCKDGHCGYCVIDKPVTRNLKVKEDKSELASFNHVTETTSCVTVIDKTASELNNEGHLEIDFVLPVRLAGKKLKEKLDNQEITEDKMWVYDFAKREATIKENTIIPPKMRQQIKIRNI